MSVHSFSFFSIVVVCVRARFNWRNGVGGPDADIEMNK